MGNGYSKPQGDKQMQPAKLKINVAEINKIKELEIDSSWVDLLQSTTLKLDMPEFTGNAGCSQSVYRDPLNVGLVNPVDLPFVVAAEIAAAKGHHETLNRLAESSDYLKKIDMSALEDRLLCIKKETEAITAITNFDMKTIPELLRSIQEVEVEVPEFTGGAIIQTINTGPNFLAEIEATELKKFMLNLDCVVSKDIIFTDPRALTFFDQSKNKTRSNLNDDRTQETLLLADTPPLKPGT